MRGVPVRVFDRFAKILLILTVLLGLLASAVFLLGFKPESVAILYNLHPLFTQIANSDAYLIAGGVLGAATGLSALWLIWRSILLRRHSGWLDAGCPHCQQHELTRIERYPTDRLRHVFGLPAYRYQCRNCAWQGLRLSAAGLSASPRSRLGRMYAL
jgi:hypothetical protein